MDGIGGKGLFFSGGLTIRERDEGLVRGKRILPATVSLPYNINHSTSVLNRTIYMFIKTAGLLYKSIQKIIHKNNLILYKTKIVYIIHCSYVAINTQNAF